MTVTASRPAHSCPTGPVYEIPFDVLNLDATEHAHNAGVRSVSAQVTQSHPRLTPQTLVWGVHVLQDCHWCASAGTNTSFESPRQLFSAMLDGNPNTGIACDQPTTSWKGKTVFEIWAPSDVRQLKITHLRPQYAPGWKIYRDGNLLLDEAANRGGGYNPSPTTYANVWTAGRPLLQPTKLSPYDLLSFD